MLDKLTRMLSKYVVSIWAILPLSRKLAVKNWLFEKLPFLFSHTRAFKNWAVFTGSIAMKEAASFQQDPPTFESPIASQKIESIYVDKLAGEVDPQVKLIAFYLPQFHAVAENDKWWGEGFTEWTNVKPATPKFKNHYQPHVPGELGYYDLSNVDVQRQQVELAKQYGLGGFCFYFYWFAGTRLLETPIKQFFDAKDIDFPYCLCWANENWSRRWDGLDNDILIAQDHSEQDDLAFIEYISQYFQDDRYIKVDGKPLLVVYRPGLLPDAKATSERWRKWCRENGIGEIHLASTLSFDTDDPRKNGFDVTIEFPPNNMGPRLANEFIEDADSNFSGAVYDWGDLADRSEKYDPPRYPLIRSVCPSWDNTARKKERATVFAGSSPQRYARWLSNAIKDTAIHSPSNDQLVFVNAWNEWAEGAHLEPDERYGYAYLEATRQALNGNKFEHQRKIVLVAHDAHPHGAQNLILHMAKSLKNEMGFAVDMVVLGGGPLLSEYAKYATLHCLPEDDHQGDQASELVNKLWMDGCTQAICNTAVTGLFSVVLKNRGFNIVSLVHEMPQVIREHKLELHCQELARVSDKVVFPAHIVRDGFFRFADVDAERVEIKPQGLFRRNHYAGKDGRLEAKRDLERRWSVPADAKCVVAVGYADRRKGIDIYIDVAIKILQQDDNTYFVWVGHFDAGIEEQIKSKVVESGYQGHFIFPGLDFDSDIYYAAADVYALTSREDPFPCVVLEALGVATPVVAFEGAGGFDELLSRAGGLRANAFEVDDFACCVKQLLNDPCQLERIGTEGRALVEKEFSFNHYLFTLLEWAGCPLKKVSVIVPNYNYADHLRARIESIMAQDYPIYELIILDDASTDGSVELIEELLAETVIDSRLVVNKTNSGSPFIQWKKGVEMASGDYIWIAEADDLATSDFISELIVKFDYPSVALSYCESQQIDELDTILANNYEEYLSDISITKWKGDYIINGQKELCTSMVVKNTVPNVSAVLFKRSQIESTLKKYGDKILSYRFAGDWMLYVALLSEDAALAFSRKPMNQHRRHTASVTQQSYGEEHLNEVVEIQDYIIKKFDIAESDAQKVYGYRNQLSQQFNVEIKSPVTYSICE